MGKKKLTEIIRFAISGGVCFLIEFALLVLLRDTCGLDTLVATPIAFTVSVIVNYLFCVKWVFPDAGKQGNKARIAFFISSIMGLFLNEGLMWLFRILFGEDTVVMTVFGFTITMYMVNKVLATLIVMVWNYITKRYILKKLK